MKKYIIDKEYNDVNVGFFLKDVIGYSTRNLRNSDIYLNGKKVKLKKKIKFKDTLIVSELKKGTNIVPMKMDLDIIYEDNDLLILNKPPHLIVHPTKKKVDKTLANGVVHYFIESHGLSSVPRFFNRLDMDTTGIIVVTKNAFSQALLQNKDKINIEKYYLAIVDGIVPEDEFLIERPIGRVGDSLRREELSIENGGQSAKTKINVIKRFEEKNISLLKIQLFTGRTHQIRVHLSLEGFPIIGDSLYGSEDQPVERQFLHAFQLIITNLDSKEKQIFSAPLPEDMKKFLNIN
ncbi:RluA family pseudouridine synthase [Fusobacterium sp. IOR10]|uniref:RluA family pseudouridine synthase n=1 Tax=Fusobacterium sp. IOR10 TaxID=2665157 RepID=UPI0013D79EF7|nr:RluA family pseudouridine synthase [Fusobacterium sp. IOR10]